MSRKFLTPIVLPADPAAAMEAATKQYVDNRPAGDEVWIGTSDPGAAYELWYDTDEPNLYEPDTMRWNTAWGIVGVGTFTFGDGAVMSVGSALTNPLIVAMVAGRRYRISFVMRAIASAATTSGNISLYVDGVGGPERWWQVLGNTGYNLINMEWLSTAGTGSHSFAAYWSAGAGVTGYSGNGHFYVEDVGPVSLSSSPPAQPSSVWTAPTLLNGWANSGAPHQTCQYRLLGDKVELRGRINLGTMNTSIFTLPVGYRPLATTTLATGSVVSGSWAFGVVEVTTDGSVAVYSPASNQGVVLNNLSFSVTA